MSNPSNKPAKSRPTRNKVKISNAGYLDCDESIIIPSDTSDISDWDWIVGGFPCRDVIREHIISDNMRQQEEPSIPSLDPQITQSNKKTELLGRQDSSSDPLACPISINSAGQSPNQPHTTTQLPPDSKTKHPGENGEGHIDRLPNLRDC